MNKTKIKLSSGMESEDIKKKVHLSKQCTKKNSNFISLDLR